MCICLAIYTDRQEKPVSLLFVLCSSLSTFPFSGVMALCKGISTLSARFELGVEIVCKLMSRLPVNFNNVQIWAHLGASKWWGHSVLQTPALVCFRTCHCRVMPLPFFDPFFDFYSVNQWNLVNTISGQPLNHDIWHTDCVQGLDDLINFLSNSVNILLNYLPFQTLAFCVVKQPCQQNIWPTAWARIIIIRHTVWVHGADDLVYFFIKLCDYLTELRTFPDLGI